LRQLSRDRRLGGVTYRKLHRIDLPLPRSKSAENKIEAATTPPPGVVAISLRIDMNHGAGK
jgi:hypothetical protein